MKTFVSVLVACCLVWFLVPLCAGQQPGPGPKPLPEPPVQPGARPAVPSPTAPGGVPTLPMPGSPYLPPTQPYGPAAAPNTAPAPAAGQVGPANPLGSPFAQPALPTAPSPAYPSAAPARPVSPGLPTTATFSDPVFGPYTPTAGSIGPTPGFGTFAPSAPAATYEKPFSSYTPPPVYSPYMNLYRFNPRGPIDNYYSLVRPFVQQNMMNRQFGNQLHGLQMNNRLQETMIQRLQQQNQLNQGGFQPSYYMNHGGFYQGY